LKRLVKVAKEFNVGIGTIVDCLKDNGFEIESKPTSKVTDEMYPVLLKEFQANKAVKEQADALKIGNRNKEEEVEVASPPPAKEEIFKNPEPTPVEPEKPEPTPELKKEAVVDRPTVSGPKVVGKIDLNTKKETPKTVKEEPKKVDAKKEAPKKVEAKKEASKKVEAKKEEPKNVEAKTPAAKTSDAAKTPKSEKKKSDTMKAEAPELRGLKILGKIEIADKKPKDTKKPIASSNDAKKRKRRRRKITDTRTSGGNNRGGKGGNAGKGGKRSAPVVKEVSQKEIEDKIKATMAKISGGSKKKRQKIRREHRETTREKQEAAAAEKQTDVIQLTEFISVSDLASLFEISVTDVIMTCMNLGVIVSINQRLDAEIIELVAEEFNREIEFISAEEQDEEEEEIIDDPADLVERAPIVTVMGHVDHGKTSLLDYIRSENVASGEAGGITQHIGAYEVKTKDSRKVTFLDTPGHEAFTAMRARGAKVTDVAVIIIAADDAIMPQTKEAISHAQAAGVPMIFAINKIDKDGADPERIKGQLAEMNILVEDWGGTFQSQDISAKKGTNIDLLLEKILLESDMLELKANPGRNAMGTVIEASLDKGRGYVTKMLVLNGTLHVGDSLVAGEHSGKVKAMFNEAGKKVKSAGPAAPVLVLGLNGAPQAGEKFKETETDQEARSIATKRNQIIREQNNRASKRISLDEIGRRLALGTFKELNLIVKGDVDGSIEALADALIKQSIDTVSVNVIHKAVGQIIESDVLLASASDAIIVGFQVRPSQGARQLAEREGVEIKTYSIIYEAIDEIRSAIEGLLEPKEEEKITAQVEVREVYKISRVGTIAGCIVQEGKVARNNYIRIIRDGIVIYPTKEGAVGEISSLKRFKDDVKEVKVNTECGVSIKGYNDIKVGDIFEAYEVISVKQTLD
jgi:translation initiation factor IF-2